MFLTKNFDFCLKLLSTWMQMQNWKPHPNLSTKDARYDHLKIKSNEELHIPMQIALNNRKVQNGIHKIYHVLLTDGQNEMWFSFLCFLIEREHFWQKIFFWFFFGQKPHFLIKITDLWNSITTLFGPGHAKTCLMPYANNKGADQPAHLVWYVYLLYPKFQDSS